MDSSWQDWEEVDLHCSKHRGEVDLHISSRPRVLQPSFLILAVVSEPPSLAILGRLTSLGEMAYSPWDRLSGGGSLNRRSLPTKRPRLTSPAAQRLTRHMRHKSPEMNATSRILMSAPS